MFNPTGSEYSTVQCTDIVSTQSVRTTMKEKREGGKKRNETGSISIWHMWNDMEEKTMHRKHFCVNLC